MFMYWKGIGPRMGLAQKNVEQLVAVVGSFQTDLPLVSLCIGLYEALWDFIPTGQCNMNTEPHV